MSAEIFGWCLRGESALSPKIKFGVITGEGEPSNVAGTGTVTLSVPLLTCEAPSVRLQLEASFTGRAAPDGNQAGLFFFFPFFCFFSG